MSDISIDPTKNVSIKIKLQSLQDVGYDFQVIKDHTQIEEYNGSLGSKNDTAIISLKSTSGNYIGCYIDGDVQIADPNGEGSDYDIVVSLQQDEADLNPTIELTGKTTDDKVIRYPQFHISSI